MQPQAAPAAAAGAGPSAAAAPGAAPQGGLAPVHRFRRADELHRAPHIMRPVGVGACCNPPVITWCDYARQLVIATWKVSTVYRALVLLTCADRVSCVSFSSAVTAEWVCR